MAITIASFLDVTAEYGDDVILVGSCQPHLSVIASLLPNALTSVGASWIEHSSKANAVYENRLRCIADA